MPLEEQLLGRPLKLEPPGPGAEERADGLRESGRGVGDQGGAVFGRRAPARQ